MSLTIEAKLSENLRECTAAAHADAEQSLFMVRLLDGGLTKDAVADLTGQLWFIYSALERGVRMTSGLPNMAGIADVRLERLAALESDLVELVGPAWKDRIVPTGATVAYVDRLNALADSSEELGLIAHHYVRYLGDLAGGQVIARMLSQWYGIGPEGVNFYDFSELGKVKPFRDGYRDRLDALSLSVEEVEKLVAEANDAFRFNREVFNDLAGRHCGSLPAQE